MFVWIPNIQAQQDQAEKKSDEWWAAGHWQRPKPNPQAKLLSLIQVKGNKFINSKGDTVLLRGLTISDPDKLESQGYWNKKHFENEDIIDLIRAYDNEIIPLVAGFDWAYDLAPLHYDPIDAKDIAYVTHPYAMKRSQPWEPKWEENFGVAADHYPVVATEFGFWLDEGKEMGEDDYGPRNIKYLENRGISWICWVFDPEWHPRMLKSWESYSLTGGGEFFKNALHGKIGK